MSDVQVSECTACAYLVSSDLIRIHCVHFDDKVIHWHEAHNGNPHCVCGPDHGIRDEDGWVVHTGGDAAFIDPALAQAEFARRVEVLRLGVEA